MLIKNMVNKSLVCVTTILLLVSGLVSACEPEETDPEESEESSQPESSEESDSPMNLFEMILDRYPLLDKIIQMLLDFIYLWLGNINFNLG